MSDRSLRNGSDSDFIAQLLGIFHFQKGVGVAIFMTVFIEIKWLQY